MANKMFAALIQAEIFGQLQQDADQSGLQTSWCSLQTGLHLEWTAAYQPRI